MNLKGLVTKYKMIYEQISKNTDFSKKASK